MSRKDDDYIGQVPHISPAQDEIASYQRAKAKGRMAAIGEVPEVASASVGSSTAMKSLLTLVVLVLLVTAAWAGYLHMKLQAADRSLMNYEVRIADLERQLSVTDESMSESSVAMKVKLRELDSEIRKLWDNVWKKSRQRLDEHDASLAKQQTTIDANAAFVTTARSQLAETTRVIAGLKEQLEQAKRLQATVSSQQSKLKNVESTAESAIDKVNSLNSEVAKLERRIKETEEWIASINGFRRQVNRDLNTLKQNLGQSPGTP